MRQRIAVALLFTCPWILAGCGGGDDAASDAGAVASAAPPTADTGGTPSSSAPQGASSPGDSSGASGMMLGPTATSSGGPPEMPGATGGMTGPPAGMSMPGASSSLTGPPGMSGATGGMTGPPGGMPGASMPGASSSLTGTPGGAYPGMSGGSPSGYPAGYPGSSPGGPPGAYPGSVPGAYPGAVSGGAPAGYPGGAPGVTSGSIGTASAEVLGSEGLSSADVSSGGANADTLNTGGELNSGGGLSGAPAQTGAYPPRSAPGGTPGSFAPGSAPPGGYPGIGQSGGATGGYPGISGAPPGTPGAPGLGAGANVGSTGVPGLGNNQAQPTTFDALADFAFQQNRELDAFQYLYAYALTTDAGAAEILSTYQWVSGLKRPAIAVRWGVGLQITAPPNFTQSPQPIGSQQSLGTRTAGRGREGSGSGVGSDATGFGGGVGFPGSGGGIGGGGASNSAVAKYAGELGDRIMSEFQSRISDGKFGKVLQDAPQPGTRAGGGAGFGGTGEPGFSSPPGFPGGTAQPGFAGGIPGGMPGMGMPGGAAAAGKAAEGSIAPGLTFLGTGSEKELLERAKKNSIDVLAVFQVKLTVNRSNIVINETELVLLDGSKPGRPMFSTTPLTNIKVQQARQQGKDDDGIEKEVTKLFDFIDKNLSMAPLPQALTAELVKTKRVDVLAKQSHDNPLPVLAEFRFYNRNKLLSDADMVSAMSQILSNEEAAKTLADGNEENRKQAISKWLPKG